MIDNMKVAIHWSDGVGKLNLLLVTFGSSRSNFTGKGDHDEAL
jgi:hypothetical protein